MSEAAQRASVVAEARCFIGTPYHHMGRIKGVGVDCATIIAEVYHACGLVPPQEIGYYSTQFNHHSTDETYMQCVLRHAHEVERPNPGDMVLWRFKNVFGHGAIVTDWPRVVHAVEGAGVIEDDISNCPRLGDARRMKFFSLWNS